jgi:crotonobetaine/carnitine-CoA ligase
VGCVLEGFEVRVADDSNDPLPAGQTGEILVRSRDPCAVMLGYDGDPKATVEAWRDLWFHTGDAGYFDAAGGLHFVGRVRDAIRVRGENVSASDIEDVIARVDGVLEVAAVAVPSELGGDEIKIAVVAQAGSKLQPAALIAYAEKQLPKFAVPRYVEFVASLPKTETNKVRKNVLRETPFTPATWDRLAQQQQQQQFSTRQRNSNV